MLKSATRTFTRTLPRTFTRTVTGAIRRLVERHLPDSLIIALLLSLAVIIAAVAVERQSPLAVLDMWGNGAFSLLALSMQVLLMVLAGIALAGAAPLNRGWSRLAGVAHTPGRALVLVSLVALAASLLHWGLGLVAGALCARALARHVPVDYRLLVASAYSGVVVWHGGLSGRIPHIIAGQSHPFADRIGTLGLDDTLFTTFNLGIVASLCVALPLFNRLLSSGGAADATNTPPPDNAAQTPRGPRFSRPVERLEHSRWLSRLVAGLGLAFVLYDALWLRKGLTLDTLNLALFAAALLLHRTPQRLYACLRAGIENTASLILQFPLYAGIMAVMAQSGLALSLTEALIAPATAASLSFWVFISAGALNLLVPFGGEQWLMQAPAVIPTAEALGVGIPRAAMAVAWGDAWSNLIQPFWLLPMLAITGLKARDILGIGLLQLLVSGALISAGLLWL
ncbi:TIGR00366 family protein [Vreelandella subglaciescola]|jgi:short-chain fatty acids transporter|uniref:Short-chain fatty acids transporter n=1 Tax=Vreelandella subglaciescola TaxID=29571 RepID=A0A1M7HSF2_9GAMM|nr:TIGR00366 family protein [Halomonas subglaciescola]SHM31446.1 short-chain fatty acids transporter [Halomonas subglaciescola]